MVLGGSLYSFSLDPLPRVELGLENPRSKHRSNADLSVVCLSPCKAVSPLMAGMASCVITLVPASLNKTEKTGKVWRERDPEVNRIFLYLLENVTSNQQN